MFFRIENKSIAIEILLLITLISTNSFTQINDNYYTKGLVNGYAWSASPSASMLAYTKGESLSRMLNIRKYQTQDQRELSFPLGCDDEVEELLRSNTATNIDLQTIEKLIDKFYEKKENLIIPVLGAYCCCIKEISGVSPKELEKFRQELLDFSDAKLKQ